MRRWPRWSRKQRRRMSNAHARPTSFRGPLNHAGCQTWQPARYRRDAPLPARSSNCWIIMSDVIEFLKTRRSVKPREMNGAGPTQAELETILTIGARVPDHGKIAPWRFIVFEGDARKKAGEIIAQVFIK